LTEDVYPVWNGTVVHEPVVTTRGGAVTAGLNRAVSVLAGGLLILVAARRIRGDRRRVLACAGVFAAGAAFAWGAAHFASLEKVEARRWKSSSEARATRIAGLTQREIYHLTREMVDELTKKSEDSSLAS